MIRSLCTLGLAALIAPAFAAEAQTAASPAGHWQGAIYVPSGDVPVSVDLVQDGDALSGTFSNPGERIRGFPLAQATRNGNALKLDLKIGEDAQAFAGSLSADGQSFSGDFLVSVYAVPFKLTRTGDAEIAAVPSSPAIDDLLAGDWTAALMVGQRSLAVALTLANRADGTASGSWASAGSTMTPVTIDYADGRVTLSSTVLPASYAGALNADGTEMTGVFKEGATEQPLTFRRVAQR